METRWLFHRLQMPLDRGAALRHAASGAAACGGRAPARRRSSRTVRAAGCRRSSARCSTSTRVGDVAGIRDSGRASSSFLRSGDARPLEPVLEHNRLDLVSLAAVMARAVRARARTAMPSCRDGAEALALGRSTSGPATLDRASRRAITRGELDRRLIDRTSRAEALYRLALRLRRDRRFAEAAASGAS